MLLPAEYASSYCMGNSSNPAAAGSPYLDKTAELPAQLSMMGGCIDHTMGFADAVEPLARFLLEVLAAES